MRTVLLALTAFLLAVPAYGQSGPEGDFLRSVRGVADIISGQRVGPQGDQVVDKVLGIGRDDAGAMIVTGIQVLAPGASNDGIQINGRAIAALRTRASTPGGNQAPDPDDIAYVRRTGLRLFIVGEWATPPILWEIERDHSNARLRAIGPDGRPGPWQAPAG
ncbi:MAG TPA: hypothetical protein VMS43_01880 [Allosphingosinicella sp.]|nr:hypothetical protein [Allosphingosinicella sp.]